MKPVLPVSDTSRRALYLLGLIAALKAVGLVLLATGIAAGIAGLAGGATLLGIAPWLPATPGPAPHFVDETASSGLDFTYDGPFAYAVGGGVAVFDCNGDGREDLIIETLLSVKARLAAVHGNSMVR